MDAEKLICQGIYLAGTILINQPWGADGYSALDTTLLDRHFGNIDTWRNAITEIHRRGMYVLLDNTMATSVLRMLPLGNVTWC